MKSMKLAVATAFLLGWRSAAVAQSAVAIYGVLDESVQYTHNGAGLPPQFAMYEGQLTTDQWGVLGKEDVGGGWSAIFRAENHFNLTNGRSGRMWSKSFVGIENDSYGTLSVGRQLDPLQDLVTYVQGNGTLEYFTSPGDIDNGDGTIVTSNAIKWTSPAWGALRTELMYSFGNVSGSLSSGQTYSAAAIYKSNHVQVAAGYFHIDYGNPARSTRTTSSEDSIFNSPVNAAYSSAKSLDIARAGFVYSISTWLLGTDYSFAQYVADASSSFRDSERFNSIAVFVAWNVKPDMKVESGYVFMKSHGDSSATYNQLALAGDYLLSKQTDLYAILATGHASGSNGLGEAEAVIADTFQSVGSASQQIAIVGIRHRF